MREAYEPGGYVAVVIPFFSEEYTGPRAILISLGCVVMMELIALKKARVMKAARLLAPVDIEAFFQLHFTKVGAQTRLILDEWATQATQNGMNCQKLLALQEALSTHDQRHATP